MTGRERALPRPTRSDEWRVLAVDEGVAKDWDRLSAMVTNAAVNAWEALAQHPTQHSPRQHRLKGDLGWGTFKGRELPRWQYEVTSAGRLWYLVDEEPPVRRGRPKEAGRVLVERIHFGHPKETE